MSCPVSICSLIKAVHDPEVTERLLLVMERNAAHGAFSIYPCKCDPACVVPDEDALKVWLSALVDAREPATPQRRAAIDMTLGIFLKG